MGACRKMPIFVDMCSADSAGGCRHLSAAPREDSHNARAAFRACHQRSLVKHQMTTIGIIGIQKQTQNISRWYKMIQTTHSCELRLTSCIIFLICGNYVAIMWHLCEFLQQKSSTNTAGSSFEALLVLILSCACQGHGRHGSLHWMVDRFLLQ